MNLEAFYAAGLAADYCSTGEGWENFTGWARKEGILGDSEELPREVMNEALHAIRMLVREAEIELFQARLREALKNES